MGKHQWIITQDITRESYLASSSSRELLIVMETVTGDGSHLPPMLIISAQEHIESWYHDLPDDWLVGVSESGYSNDQLAHEWLKHFN